MKRFIYVLAALIALLALVPMPGAAQETVSREEAAAAAATLAMQYGGAASVQYALFADGDIALSGSIGYARLETAEPASDDLLYGFGSVSKVYTAAAVLKLCEEGRVALDEPVTAYLPDFTMADPRYTQITVRMLLNHSAGFQLGGVCDGFLFDDPQAARAKDTLLSKMSTQRLIADPGAYSAYSNAGYTLAELLVERVTGMTLGDYLREVFLNPLGLADTYACPDPFDRTRLACAYFALDPTRAVAADSVNCVGAGGLYGTARDLARFGGTFSGLLSGEAFAAMTADEYARGLWPQDCDGDALSFGLGWDAVRMLPFAQSGIQALYKGGDDFQYHAALVVLPEYGMAAAVLSSGGLSTYNQLAAARMLLDTLAAQGVAVNESFALPAAQPAAMPESMQAYAGVYASSTAWLNAGISADGVLTLTQNALGYSQQFVYCDDGSFRDASGTVLIRFVEEANGQTYLYQKGFSAIPGLTVAGAASYAYQKLEPQPLDPEIEAAWTARADKLYLQINSRYTSQTYALSLPCTAVSLNPDLPGYVAVNRIVDAQRAESAVQIPGTAGRDCMDIALYEQDGLEYLSVPGYLYVEDAAAAPLDGQREIAIGADGYARWFTLDEALAGKTLTVALPAQGSFSVYDANGLPVVCSAAYGDTSAVLPAGGYAVFAGEPGQTFEIRIE